MKSLKRPHKPEFDEDNPDKMGQDVDVIDYDDEEVEDEDTPLQKQIDPARLDALGMSLSALRIEAVRARANSGIENVWLEDEEFYEGIDDANRGTAGTFESKPPTQPQAKDATTGSTIFTNITQPYCDSAAARTSDMLLPTDDRAWELLATPVVELTRFVEGNFPRDVDQQIIQAQTDPETGDVNEEGIERTRQEIVAKAEEDIAIAKEAVDKASTRIDDWHVECQYHAEVRSVIESVTQTGSGVLKGPVAKKRKMYALGEDNTLEMVEKIQPGSHHISNWNFYPAADCGNNIHNGSCVWEKDNITKKKLRELKGSPGYLESQIDIVLNQDAHVATAGSDSETNSATAHLSPRDLKNLYQIWYFTGEISREEIEAAGCECPEGQDFISAEVTMVNNVVIRAVSNLLDTGEFPYDIMVWQKRKDSPFGIGVARQMRTPQKIVTAAVRAMMDNAGRASGPQVIFKRGVIEPVGGNVYQIQPWGMWEATEDADLQNLDNAFRFVKVDMYQAEMEAIIMLGLRLAEEVTGLPVIMQGQTSSSTPDTLGGMQLQDDNASTVLRRIARLFDDLLTEPHLRRYYRWLMQFGEDDEKGDFVVDARGSSALVARDMQSQEVLGLFQFGKDPVYGLDPKKLMAEYLKSRRMDIKRFEFDDEEWQKIVEQMSQPQQTDSSVEVATIRAEAVKAVAEIRAQIDGMKIESNEEIKVHEFASDQREGDLDRDNNLEVKAMDQALKQVDMGEKRAQTEQQNQLTLLMKEMEKEFRETDSGRKQITEFEKIKAQMAELVMTLDMQKELSTEGGGQVAEPVVEPPQRAPDGEAFAQ